MVSAQGLSKSLKSIFDGMGIKLTLLSNSPQWPCFTILVTKSLRSYTQNDHPKQKGGDIEINQWARCSSDGSPLENNVPKLYFYLIPGEHVSRICKEIPEADSCLQSWNLQRGEVGNVYLTPTPPIPIQWSRKLGWLWAEQGIKERTSQMPSSKGLQCSQENPLFQNKAARHTWDQKCNQWRLNRDFPGEDAGREQNSLPYIFQALLDSYTIIMLPCLTCAVLKFKWEGKTPSAEAAQGRNN